MGNSGPNKSLNKTTTAISEMHFLSQKQDQRYGRVFLYQHKTTNDIFALKQILLKSASEFKKEVNILTARCQPEKSNENPERIKLPSNANLVRVVSFSTHNEDNMCSSFYKIDIVIEYLEQDLEKEISERKANGKAFSEGEIWYLLECLVSALGTLHQLNVAVGYLTPSNVYISKERVYKLADPSLMNTDEVPGYYQNLIDASAGDLSSSRIAYLSPQLLTGLAQKMRHPKHNAFKSDVFALGLTMLHAATLNDCDDLYDWRTYLFMYQSLKAKLGSLRTKYSDRLLELLNRLLEQEEHSRPDINQLRNELSQSSTNEGTVDPVKDLPQASSEQEHAVVKTFKNRAEAHKLQSGAPVEEPILEIINQKEVQSRKLSEEFVLEAQSQSQNKYGSETESQKNTLQDSNNNPKPPERKYYKSEYSNAALNRPQYDPSKYSLPASQQPNYKYSTYSSENTTLLVQSQSNSKIIQYDLPKKESEGQNPSPTHKPANIDSNTSNLTPKKTENKQNLIPLNFNKENLSANNQYKYTSLDQEQTKEPVLNQEEPQMRYSSPEKLIEEYKLRLLLNGAQTGSSPLQNTAKTPVDVEKVIESIKAKSGNTYSNPVSYRDGTKLQDNSFIQSSSNFKFTVGSIDKFQKNYQSPQNPKNPANNFRKKEKIDVPQLKYDTKSPDRSIAGQYSERSYVKQYSPKKYTKYRAQPQNLNYVTETYTDGSLYEGQISNDKKHGRGRFYFSDGSMYDGDWDNDAMHGVGTLYYSTGNIAYEGRWSRGKFHGRATAYNEHPTEIAGNFDFKNFDGLGSCWIKYNGEFVQDVKCGFGTLFLSNGDQLFAKFQDDMVHGKGTYTFANGQILKAEWQKNRLVENQRNLF